jgi:hypothetical protein
MLTTNIPTRAKRKCSIARQAAGLGRRLSQTTKEDGSGMIQEGWNITLNGSWVMLVSMHRIEAGRAIECLQTRF